MDDDLSSTTTSILAIPPGLSRQSSRQNPSLSSSQQIPGSSQAGPGWPGAPASLPQVDRMATVPEWLQKNSFNSGTGKAKHGRRRSSQGFESGKWYTLSMTRKRSRKCLLFVLADNARSKTVPHRDIDVIDLKLDPQEDSLEILRTRRTQKLISTDLTTLAKEFQQPLPVSRLHESRRRKPRATESLSSISGKTIATPLTFRTFTENTNST